MSARKDKYQEKISGEVSKKLYDAQKDLMVANQTKPTKDLVEIELKVKGICNAAPALLQYYYIIFAKECYSKTLSHTGTSLVVEIYILEEKWRMRGLDDILLHIIKALFINIENFFPPGIVKFWSGAIADIPAGWVLCDGNNGSPDLQDNFVRGAGNTYNPDDTGGSTTHTHNGSIAFHNHTLTKVGTKLRDGLTVGETTPSNNDTFTTNPGDSLPTHYALAFIYNPKIPQKASPNSIVLWSGSIASIPSGWNLCDGNNSTINLEDKFIIGAGNTYNVGAIGGNTTHTHTGTTNGHTHGIGKTGQIDLGTGGDRTSTNVAPTFTTDGATSIPPYYALAYIQNTSGIMQSVRNRIIVIWAGSVGSIPIGFVLCNGNNGTPDLRDEFIVCAGNNYAVDATGGTSTNSHVGTTNPHRHIFAKAKALATGVGIWSVVTDYKSPTLSTTIDNHIPPYYALAYIMKT